MMQYQDEAQLLLDAVGGRENIMRVTHCVTRMRFVLRDLALADKDKIQKITMVKGLFAQAGQFQVIIGNEVADFYQTFIALAGIEESSKESVKEAAKDNMTMLQRLMANLAEIFSPLIPAIITGGLILGFRNVIGDIAFFDEGTQTLVDKSQFWSGVHAFLWLIGEAIFHFLPVGITWSITRKMGSTQILGIVLGLTLTSPQLLNAYAVAGGAEIPFWDFGFAKMNMIGYQAQVIPAMLAGFALVYLERFWRKITPEAISMIIVPFFALVPTVILAHALLGPMGWIIGSAISQVVYSGLTSAFGWLFALIFGFFYAPLVITGLHHMTNAIDLQLMAEFGGTMLWPMIALSNIAQGSAVLAMIMLHRQDKKEQQVAIPATISAYLGVTEPAMFGINLKYGYPFLMGMIGSGLAGLFSVATGVMANSIGVGGLPGILSIQPKFMLLFLIAMSIAVIVPLILTLGWSKRVKN
ncbi:PTS system trehalose-specific EIIBC component [Entomospira culicis]|uniref:PTS system trehalose-specific EIIBC component n=2 Tax=Entomospira culicis TaxID=2719989 RepID=A0A968GGG3_9SPIO|nr:PTS system trehalose-specific EIIBC component [Entomospira culicis]NIZ19162.1 PTS system trehalose-specific EIIBC component [Entomospira culicis]NIZ69376.1 PTS system trehalose-specific EIIBC component [Entomospira culicis]WDI38119.1 PTS system trehalose-specific EIIBC component [Entomospira culicis]